MRSVNSRCSQGVPIEFRWFGSPFSKQGQDKQTLLEKFKEEIIFKPGRVRNDYVTTMAVTEIKKLINLAERGGLRAPKQINSVDRRGSVPLFEIRWQHIRVQETKDDGALKTSRILVRMYHSEPEIVPGYFVGHHIHEKDLSSRVDINTEQNNEIRVARNYYEHGKPSLWGLGGN